MRLSQHIMNTLQCNLHPIILAALHFLSFISFTGKLTSAMVYALLKCCGVDFNEEHGR